MSLDSLNIIRKNRLHALYSRLNCNKCKRYLRKFDSHEYRGTFLIGDSANSYTPKSEPLISTKLHTKIEKIRLILKALNLSTYALMIGIEDKVKDRKEVDDLNEFLNAVVKMLAAKRIMIGNYRIRNGGLKMVNNK